jgi:hypothetical protein
MSHERRKPFALLHPNARPTDPVLAPNSAPPQLPISRPRRQMPAYHHQLHQQYNPHKRYATVLPGSSRSSATSSAESLHSTRSLMTPRRRKLSAAEDVAARVRARWAALEALERTSGGPAPIANPADTITATHTNSATTAATTTTTSAMGPDPEEIHGTRSTGCYRWKWVRAGRRRMTRRCPCRCRSTDTRSPSRRGPPRSPSDYTNSLTRDPYPRPRACPLLLPRWRWRRAR